MYSQFERQYKDFLRANLTTLDIPSHRSSEHDLLSYLRPLTSSLSCGALVPSQKSEALAQAHLSYGRELRVLGDQAGALVELGEAARNSTSPSTLEMIMKERGGGVARTVVDEVPRIKGSAMSPDYPYVEGCVEVRESEGRGRHVVATRDIAIGMCS